VIPEFDVIFIGTDPSKIDISISKLKEIIGVICSETIMEHSGIEKIKKKDVRF